MQHVLLGLFVVGNSIVALMVYLNNPRSATNRLFTWLIGTITCYLAVNTELYLFPGFDTKLFLSKMIMAFAALINLFVLLFLTTFPQEKTPLKPWAFWASISSSLALFFIAMSGGVISTITVTTDNLVVPSNGWAMPLFGLHTLIMVVAGLINIFLRYRHSQGLEKSRFRYVFFGFLVLFSLIIVFNFILPTVFKIGFFVPLLPIYLLLFNTILAYAIIKHRLLDIRVIVARTVSFTLLTVFLAALYALVLFRLPSVLPQTYQIPAYVVVAIILAYTFSPLRTFVERISDNVFHRSPYDSDVFLEDLGNILRSTLDINRLTKLVLKQLTEALQLQYAAFILEDETHQIKTYTVGTAPALSFTTNTLHNIITSSDYEVILFDELEESPLKMLFRQYEIGAVLPLTVKSVHHGIVILGYKSSGDVFNNQDINVLNILLPQLSIAIQNAKSFDEISKFNVKLREEIDRATSDLKKANRNLKHLDKLKDEFVFIATHELKNPVTAMRGYISMFQEGIFGSIPDKMKEPMTQLQASNQQLVELVNDLLQIARTEAKTLTIHTEPVELFPLIDAIKASVKPLADQKSITIDYQHPASLPQVQADSQRVKEIINNLLSNAIKYSDKGTIRVSHELQPHFVITHVSDQGVGISVEDQRKLFTRFYRVEEEAAKGIPGTGLGLFIVKQLIEKMGGEIWLNSEKGIGSTFSFSLPVA